jgi:hypothetical protein
MLDLCLEEYSFQVSTKIPSILIEVVSDLTHYLQPHVWQRIKSGYTNDQVGRKVGLEEGEQNVTREEMRNKKTLN